MTEQKHEEEVKALRQEKYALQQKLQEMEVKWNHFIAQQGLQVTVTNHVITFKQWFYFNKISIAFIVQSMHAVS